MVQLHPLFEYRDEDFSRAALPPNTESQYPPHSQIETESQEQTKPVLTPEQLEQCQQVIQELLAANIPLETLTASLSPSCSSSSLPSSSSFPTSYLQQTPPETFDEEPHTCDLTSPTSLCAFGACAFAAPPPLVHDSNFEIEDFDFDYSEVAEIPSLVGTGGVPHTSVWPEGMDMGVDMGVWTGMGEEIWCMMPKTPEEWEETLRWSVDGGEPEWVKEFNREVGCVDAGNASCEGGEVMDGGEIVEMVGEDAVAC